MANPNETIRILCTGSAGSGSLPYIDNAIAQLDPKQRGKIKSYKIFDWMHKVDSSVEVGTVLNLDSELRENVRKRAIDLICDDIKTSGPKYAIIRTPATFYWMRRPEEGLNYEDIKKIKPDLVLVIIDDAPRVQQVLSEDGQWREHKFTLRELADWRAREITRSQEIIEPVVGGFPINVFLLPRDHPPSVFTDIFTSPEKPRAYFSFPITHMNAAGIAKAKAFMERLRERYVIFDPLTMQEEKLVEEWKKNPAAEHIKVEVKYRTESRIYDVPSREVEDASKVIDTEIVRRDQTFIDESDCLIVYYPGTILSVGVIYEIVYAHIHGKRVFMFHDQRPSPFLVHSTTRIFAKEEELLDFLLDGVQFPLPEDQLRKKLGIC
jgi:adenylate kinase